ncbi:puromycin sensitive aminopeptidase [Echinococcus multilocularis]|uniref:Puromycin sensitive aminopeptidase n=1 Tax=Echinococcus multilocularis TaxID=6211 RepID=A0A0S4MQ34_ECHMU|nr:puromycin sensitive aminopeptidase [Echinococcus multilocularis]
MRDGAFWQSTVFPNPSFECIVNVDCKKLGARLECGNRTWCNYNGSGESTLCVGSSMVRSSGKSNKAAPCQQMNVFSVLHTAYVNSCVYPPSSYNSRQISAVGSAENRTRNVISQLFDSAIDIVFGSEKMASSASRQAEPASVDFNNSRLLRPITVSILGGIGYGDVTSTAQSAFERQYAAVTSAVVVEATLVQAKLISSFQFHLITEKTLVTS